MASKFSLFGGSNGEFYFRLKAGNGETILNSEGYKPKASCQSGIASVKTNAPIDSAMKRELLQIRKNTLSSRQRTVKL